MGATPDSVTLYKRECRNTLEVSPNDQAIISVLAGTIDRRGFIPASKIQSCMHSDRATRSQGGCGVLAVQQVL